VIVHLIEEEYAKKPDLLSAVQAVVPKLEGSYAILVIAAGENGSLQPGMRARLLLVWGTENFLQRPT